MKEYIVGLILRLSISFGDAIIGGTPAYYTQFRYIAPINIQTSTARFFCGGTIVNKDWILTAGQCVNEAILFTIDLGSHNLVDDNPNRVTLATSEYILYPDYNSMTLENDVGLIKLRMSITFNDFLTSVDFLGAYNVVPSSLLIATGWGQTSDTEAGLSDDLQWVQVTALSTEECQLVYGSQITDNTLCVAGNYNEGACYGDTGSPLLQDLGRGYISHGGIASFVSGNGCESTDPSGYVRVFPYLTWIQNYTFTTSR